IIPALRTNRGSSVFWGLIYLLTASTRMLNIRATAKMELPKAPTTSARRKPKVLFLCCVMLLTRTPNKAMIMDTKWERTAKASEAKERELPMWATTSSTTKRRMLTTHMRINRKLLPEYRPMVPGSRLSLGLSWEGRAGRGASYRFSCYDSWISLPFRLSALVIFGNHLLWAAIKP
uniref:Uncharacterized protein n=2 Tax=Ursus TaxID=9639 RepID=A0A452V4D8_URSMA